jgi:hypothetical protein
MGVLYGVKTFLVRHLIKTHHPHLKNDRPQYVIQYQTDSPINIRALFYGKNCHNKINFFLVPSRRISQLEFAADSQQESGISLYNQRVLIKPNAKELLPHYLRFLIGVVDSEVGNIKNILPIICIYPIDFHILGYPFELIKGDAANGFGHRVLEINFF